MAQVQPREDEIRAIGQQLLSLMEGQSPSIFKRDFWQGQIMEWSMKMPAFKVEMFRFVDVLPVLKNSTEVARHIQEYFCRPDQDFPSALQWGLKTLSPGSPIARLAAGRIEKNVVGMARTFIAGTDAADALPSLRKMWKRGTAFTVDLLGEATVSEVEAADYQRRYMDLIEHLAGQAERWKPRAELEKDAFGALPRVNVSIKLSSLYSQLDPVAHDDGVRVMVGRLLPLFRRAKELGVFLNLDMEHYALKALTLDTFMTLMAQPEFAGTNAGIVIQAYLRDSAADLERLIQWARRQHRVVTVRLVKGAYWDYETIMAEQHGWPVPVYTDKGATDANFERLTRMLLENADVVRPAFGSHNVRSLAYAIAYARKLGLADDAYEFQMLYGMAEPLKAAVKKLGFRLRDYVPVGEMIPGMAYLVRRLLENTSNESWLRMRFVEGAEAQRLLAAPQAAQVQETTTGYPADGIANCQGQGQGPFVNEALLDFAVGTHRAAMAKALTAVESGLGQTCPVIIDGKARQPGRTLASLNPANPQQVVGQGALGTVQDAEDAVQSALAAFASWRDTPVSERAKVLYNAAALMRARRHQLSALITLESGKTWVSADADVAEAIDFCEYYGREMLRLDRPQRMGHVPGELNHIVYQPRGVAAVISPWNFPLAILVGMSAAALVAGNTVVMKPAEQTPAVAHQWMKILLEAGLPPGACSLVPGVGEEVGAYLVEHPKVDLIAFTGSLDVGLAIMRAAATVRPGQRGIKKVIAEMGGKNAIIIDSDADLDAAVQGTLHSAFGFQGQKCSACSRAIVLSHNYDAFVQRLVEATRSLTIGDPRDPRHHVGPVIDAQAKANIERFIAQGRQQATLALQCPAPNGGFFVGPTIFTDVQPNHTIAQEEIFGPVLSVIKVDTFDEALDVALGTRYALTGGLFSRSPINIQRARDAFRVGNLYINRGITGALVARQPFGGFAMSGVGSKAGGPDYLLNFVEPRTITENTMRRGFAPTDD